MNNCPEPLHDHHDGCPLCEGADGEDLTQEQIDALMRQYILDGEVDAAHCRVGLFRDFPDQSRVRALVLASDDMETFGGFAAYDHGKGGFQAFLDLLGKLGAV